MEVTVEPEAVRTTFFDDGHPAPIGLGEVSMPEELPDRGRRLAIAHRVLDELTGRWSAAAPREGAGFRSGLRESSDVGA